MTRPITLVGLDFGSTTSGCVIANARLATSSLGRVEIDAVEEVFRSEVIFTPFENGQLDVAQLERHLDDWLASARIAPGDVFGGGALVTGLAAQRRNAAALTRMIEARLADSLIATADDPRLESWLAFMGNCLALSKDHPQAPILNLDIGGGTTNLALGVDGQVLATGCLFVGARHFEFRPGGYEILGLSKYALALLNHLHIDRGVGDTLSPAEVDSIVDFYIRLVVAAIDGDALPWSSEVARQHVQAPFALPNIDRSKLAITLSGGVGRLAYAQLREGRSSGKSQFGDLGGELANRLIESPAIADRLTAETPAGLGRATVFGLLRHSTEVSGATIYLPRPQLLPLKDVPIVGRFDAGTSDDELGRLLDLAAAGSNGGCLQVDFNQPDRAVVESLGRRLAAQLAAGRWPAERTLVLLIEPNLGKLLGNLATRWGTLPADIIVIDEVPPREAQFVRLGRPREGVVPLWLYAAGKV